MLEEYKISFTRAFYENLPFFLDDLEDSLPWGLPWLWEDSKYWHLSDNGQADGKAWANANADMIGAVISAKGRFE